MALPFAVSFLGSASGLYVFENMWNINGSISDGSGWPIDVAVYSSGNVIPSVDVFVLEQTNSEIQKFHMSNPCPIATSQVVPGVCFVTKWGTIGSENGEFLSPSGIAIGPDGSVFVADTNNHRIQKFTDDGSFIRFWGTKGSDNGQFLHPSDVAVDNQGHVFVTDSGNNRTQKFSNTGGFIRTWGKSGIGDGEFKFLGKLDVDTSGNVFVTDGLQGDFPRVQKFTNTGSFLTKVLNPIANGIAVDPMGKVYLSEGAPSRIAEYSNGLQFLSRWGQEGSGPGQWSVPLNLDVETSQLDFKHYVYVTDPQNRRVQIYFWQPDVHLTGSASENYTQMANNTSSYATNGTTNTDNLKLSAGTNGSNNQ